MKLIADSGSTKCDWAFLVPGKDPEIFHTAGLNPFFHTATTISTTISTISKIQYWQLTIKEIHFFGAGCSTEKMRKIVRTGLSAIFPNAKIFVGHDLEGAAIATCGGQPGIACILGTGSNSCIFDGSKVEDPIANLGYVLGDEASGAWFGKQLLAHFFYKELPKNLLSLFETEYGLTRETLIERVYRQPNANVFLASFMPFLGKSREVPFIRQFLRSGFSLFFERHVTPLLEGQNLPVSFVGSVAWHFQSELSEIMKERGIIQGRFIQKPITGLIDHFSD